MTKGQKRSLFSLSLAYFADYFSWGIGFAFLSLSNSDLPFQHLPWKSEIWIWIIYAIYPIGEVLGYPIFTDLSEKISRKNSLVWSHWGSIVGMAVCAFALWIEYFSIFLLGQFLVGLFSGKLTTAYSTIMESSIGTNSQKTAYIWVLGTGAWILGPVVGVFFMPKGLCLPSLLGCSIYLLSLIFTHLFITDTENPQKTDISPAKFVESISQMLTLTWKERHFYLFLINLLAWYLLIVSLANILVSHFFLTPSQIDLLTTYSTQFFILIGFVATILFIRHIHSKNLLFWSLLTGSVAICLFFSINYIIDNWAYLAIPALTEAWLYPAYYSVLASSTNSKIQGKLFGLIGASDSICQFTAYLIFGETSIGLSLSIAIILFILSGAVLPKVKSQKREDLRSYDLAM